MWTVYSHTNKINGKRYVGMTSRKPEIRWGNGKGYHHSHFYIDICKYGWEEFTHEILFTKLTKEQAEQKEVELISKWDLTNENKGYNRATGGLISRGYHHTEENKKHFREMNTGKKLTEEHKSNISKGVTGEKNGMWGKIHNETTKQKIAEKAKGHIVSEETKKKISDAGNKEIIDISSGRIFKSITEASHFFGCAGSVISAVCRGKWNNSNGHQFRYIENGVPLEVECGRKVQKRKIKCVETGLIYNSLKEASEKTGVKSNHMSAVCSGKRKTTGGFHWEYIY